MRRKTFDVLFSTRDGMEMLVKEKCLWRSLWYFTMSRRLVLRRNYKPAFSGTALIGTFWHYCRCTGYNGRMPF